MAQPAAILNVVVLANTKGATTGLMRLNTKLAASDAKAQTMTSSLKSMGKTAGLVAGAAGLGALVLGTKKAFTEFREAQKVTNQTRAVLKSTGNQAKVTAKEVANLAEKISLYAGIDDEAIQKGENLLLTFTKIRNETGRGNKIFSEATKVVTDMSVALDQDLKSSAIQVGKALQDPEKGITALKRVGVNFTETQKDMITNWLEHGKTLKAQKFILKELNTEFGGSARAQADSADKLKVAWDNLFEKGGKAIGPWLEQAMGDLAKFLRQMENGKGAGGDFVDVLKWIGGAIKEVVVSFRHFVQWVGNAIHNMDRFGDGTRHVLQAIAGWFKDTFNNAKRIVGNVMAGILRGFAKLFDIASKLPGKVGDKFDDLQTAAENAANKIDRAGEKTKGLRRQIDLLPSKKQIDVIVDLQLRDLAEGNVPRLTPFPGRGTGDPGIEEYIEGMARRKASQVNPIGLLGGGAGVVAVGRILQAMGYQVGEHPLFGGVQGVHVPGSLHYSGRAIDVNADNFPGGEGRALDAIFPLLSRLPHAELLWRSKGHYDHLHYAMQRGGLIPGSGSGDKVPVLAEPGEGFINSRAVRALGGARGIAAINRMVPRFASGGVVARAAQAAGFTGANLLRAVAESWGESKWDENAVGDGGKAIGLMQIHTGWNPWAAALNLKNPFVNMKAAKRVFDSQGWGAWHADHVPGIAKARAAIASLTGGGTSGGGRQGILSPVSGVLGGRTVDRTPYGGIGKGGILDAFMQAAADRLNMMAALAELTTDMADDIEAARVAVGTWEQWLSVAQLNNISSGITSAAQNLKSARDLYASLTAPAEAAEQAGAGVPDESVRIGLLEQLLRESNLRTAVSQAQYGVFKNMPFAGGFASGGVVPGPLGSPQMAVVHGGETISPAGVQVIINGSITGTPRGKDPVEVVIGDRRFRNAVRDVRFRPSTPARGGGWG